MKRANKFVISPTWKLLLSDMQIDINAVLANARLPADLFNRPNPTLSPVEYFQLWYGIDKAAGERQLPLLLARHMTVESFDAPIFASICSQDLNTAVSRLREYKPLIGPMILDIEETEKETRLEISCYGHQGPLPASLSLSEMVFFTQLARLATREPITPLAVELPELPENTEEFESYFGCKLEPGKQVAIRFSAEDARKPFMTQNAAMWEFFESKLNQKLADMTSSANTVDRVRAVLLEALPGGQSTIEHVAEKLAMSKRTLQRKLTAEAETYQSVLQSVRAELADHYLEKSSMSLGEISFLLGFSESNSFIRAYSSWKGISPGNYREMFH
ncbi:AraC family transcriptional regulator [Vibrio sp. JC009]|uniref:AraC family transcriptional regulator n=1 Tax=Vibrio sp. JC009 TaxID=2912314 RepID=UPI0023AE88CD|nr:AraC family transcriptional regulator [Vibrio sp. JC009]WED21150.1 AraC family transcriptional regulator [Vibrio sp. JC009]